MKKMLAMAVAVGMSMMVATAMAGEKGGKGGKAAGQDKGGAKPQAQIVQVSGTLAVTKDANGKATAMKLTAADGTVYSIKPTDLTADLEAKDGQQVDVTAALREQKGEKFLMVRPPKGAGKPAKPGKGAKEAAAPAVPAVPAAPAAPAVPAVPAAQ